jgi:decaprenyl-phosphate phosphoribosyltransferase
MIFLKLIRAHQYTKNLFVFAALFFSGKFFEIQKVIECGIAFLAFCLAASSIYIINDLKDLDKDKQHPAKKNRPIAAGLVSVKLAIFICVILFLLSFFISALASFNLLAVILIYFVLNLFYCFGGKNISIIDVFIISTGFVLRVVAGGVINRIELSHWLIIMTFLLALFIAFAKRRDDVLIENESGLKIRNSIAGYSLEFINAISSILIAVLIVCYIMYVTSTEVTIRFNNKPIYISVLFVLLGLIRYLQISIVEKNSGSPSKLILKDRFLQCCVIAWVLFFITIIYFK